MNELNHFFRGFLLFIILARGTSKFVMTQSKHDYSVALLSTNDKAERVRVLRFIKNSIIGNRTKKDLYINLNILPRLVDIIVKNDSTTDPQSKIQAVVILGSLAYGNEENVCKLIDAGVIPPLLDCLALRNDPKLIEAAARALKAIFNSPRAPKQHIFETGHIVELVNLLRGFSQASKDAPFNRPYATHVPELAATIIARCCENIEQQLQIVSAGALPLLVDLMTCGHAKVCHSFMLLPQKHTHTLIFHWQIQEAALDALQALCLENPEIGRSVVEIRAGNEDQPVNAMLKLMIHHHSLINLSRSNVIPDYQSDIVLIVLPTVVKLITYLVSESEELQKAACDADAIIKLTSLICQSDEELSNPEAQAHCDRIKESALLAIAAISSLKEECRAQVIEAKALPHIVAAMSHKNVGVRAAACQCTRSLSRSVKNLRTSLVDAGIAIPLFNLLSDESTSVQTTASATLCNIVLGFSPMKTTVLEHGGIERLVHLVSSMDSNLRLNAVWALKNLLFQAEPEIKQTVMKHLTYPKLQMLLNDSESGIQEQALNLLRNLACDHETSINQVFEGIGESNLISLFEEKLRSDNEDIILQTLYTIVNVATGNERHKMAIVNSDTILHFISEYMVISILEWIAYIPSKLSSIQTHSKASIRVATIWCIINLTWTEERHGGYTERIRKLQNLGFESMLSALIDDIDLDVRDRVKTALGHFRSSELHP
ncbi:ARM repeat-containing protein [Basidiobolus meristosporus CBS 931.73]|uniref:ARM repeat-containing protein n=1 Tax=Basidiobolus meristosporus CBS 931.73 TaxID=1314790 RepID=A0A1Y1Z8X4_9FUNG|nr:ARM repeat-containing protein [Basidiobolus meristosporus CBS 931.73]|eukprot:ORY06467.1 ARM repeat-containing protein [Basidiobolus meristosporus CBS 931.73]